MWKNVKRNVKTWKKYEKIFSNWKKSFFLILTDAFTDQCSLFLLLWLEKKRQLRHKVLSDLCSIPISHTFCLNFTEWVQISNGNPQSFTKKKMLNFLLGERVSGWWGGKQRLLQLKRKYSVQYGILPEQNLKYISKIWISHWWGLILGFWRYLANPGQDRGKSFHLSVMDYLDIETQVFLFLSWR